MSTHTPTPWFTTKGRRLHYIHVGAGRAALATLDGSEPTVTNDAAFIVRACNSHDALVRLAQRVEEHFADTDAPLRSAARAALTLAAGEGT